MLQRLRKYEWYRDLQDLATLAPFIAWIGPAVAAVLVTVVGWAMKRPADVIVIYALLAAWVSLGVLHGALRLVQRIKARQPQPNPNIVFSHSRVEALSIEAKNYEPQIWGTVIAEFFNDVSDPKDRARDVVAHLLYYKKPGQGRELGDRLWLTREGLWQHDRSGTFDFWMNRRGRLTIALIFREDSSKPQKIYAVGYRQIDSLNPFGMETFELENYLPVIVHVALRGSGFQRRFAFALEKQNTEYISGQLATPP